MIVVVQKKKKKKKNFRWPTQKLLWPPNFPSFSCGPLEMGVVP